jgi:hypothetical protein
MGHTRLGNLPKTQKWAQVIALIQSLADPAMVAAATLRASKEGLDRVTRDPALIHSFWLLTQIPLCARKGDYVQNLRQIGIDVQEAPTLMELVGSFSDSVDARIRETGGRTDLGEMAQMGAAASLAGMLKTGASTLFGTDAEVVRNELYKLSTPRNFSILARDFFAKLTEKYVTFFASRELSNKMPSISANRDFREALALHCRQTSLIVEKFAEDWFSKHNYQGGITYRKTGAFLDYAITKIQEELVHRSGAENR